VRAHPGRWVPETAFPNAWPAWRTFDDYVGRNQGPPSLNSRLGVVTIDPPSNAVAPDSYRFVANAATRIADTQAIIGPRSAIADRRDDQELNRPERNAKHPVGVILNLRAVRS
jgi:hypothetical protein